MPIKKNPIDEENILELGWYGKIDKYLCQLAPNGIIKIKNRNDMIQLGLEMNKNYVRENVRQMKENMKLAKDFELKLVLKNKVRPEIANKSVLKHPVVAQRLRAERFLEINKEKPKKHYLRPYVVEFENISCYNIPSEAERLGIKFRELEFGESWVFDYHKHGRNLKQKRKEHNKKLGLHLPQSHLQRKLIDDQLNSLTQMNINNLQDLKIFHEKARKLMKEPFRGRY
ncbi:unnamed protein product [Macrosiphum euphorbiae]|uniref:Uncharacterized protein n=1 Tax=Macrosiphum euphorbiae TaxID=13131 RepID=A0AAV0X9E7_9HEMI|nr:unnamed protein product [Macrosiphum euphorbiae]